MSLEATTRFTSKVAFNAQPRGNLVERRVQYMNKWLSF